MNSRRSRPSNRAFTTVQKLRRAEPELQKHPIREEERQARRGTPKQEKKTEGASLEWREAKATEGALHTDSVCADVGIVHGFLAKSTEHARQRQESKNKKISKMKNRQIVILVTSY